MSSGFFRIVMSCQTQLCEGITEKYEKKGILGDCNISSQYAISFLRTFTEYPYVYIIYIHILILMGILIIFYLYKPLQLPHIFLHQHRLILFLRHSRHLRHMGIVLLLLHAVKCRCLLKFLLVPMYVSLLQS